MMQRVDIRAHSCVTLIETCQINKRHDDTRAPYIETDDTLTGIDGGGGPRPRGVQTRMRRLSMKIIHNCRCRDTSGITSRP